MEPKTRNREHMDLVIGYHGEQYVCIKNHIYKREFVPYNKIRYRPSEPLKDDLLFDLDGHNIIKRVYNKERKCEYGLQ